MKEQEIFCVIVYPDDPECRIRMLNKAVLGGGVWQRSLLPLCGFNSVGHGYVSVRKSNIVIYDADRSPGGSVPFEMVMHIGNSPVIHLIGAVTEGGECTVGFYEGMDDRMMLCGIRAVEPGEAAELRKRMRKYLADNQYRCLGDGVYCL